MKVTIDKDAGFCFGVRNSISVAEELIAKGEKVRCLGQLVHNDEEVARLEELGIEFIDYEEYRNLRNETVLLRAHGEIPETYKIAKQNNLKLIDTTCPIVTSLQKKIFCSWEDVVDNGGQIVIYGQENHPEVKGLKGQTQGSAIIINNSVEISKIDFSKDIHIFSQTTKNKTSYMEIVEAITREANKNSVKVFSKSSICNQVVNREESIINLAKTNDVVIFVAGKNSSNGRTLFGICKGINGNSHYISALEEIKSDWLRKAENVAITGSTSTPLWLLERVKEELEKICI